MKVETISLFCTIKKNKQKTVIGTTDASAALSATSYFPHVNFNFLEFKWSSISRLKNSSPSWLCEASLIALVCMHILYLSGGSWSAQIFSCHRWKRLRDGERTTISLLWRYFLYRCTSSKPQPLMLRSKPPDIVEKNNKNSLSRWQETCVFDWVSFIGTSGDTCDV